MSRTFVEKLADWQWWGEQGLHLLAGGVFAIAVAKWLPFWASWGLSTLIGLGREVWQNWGDDNNDYLDAGADLLFWSIGAALMSLVF